LQEQNHQKFGDTLNRLRKERRLSQGELADRCSLDRSYISTLERNLKQPNLSTIVALANGLDMKAYELIREMETTEKPAQDGYSVHTIS